MKNLQISIVQSDIYWQDCDKNLQQYSEKISAIDNETDLIILPEVFNAGFNNDPVEVAEEMDGKTMKWMAEEAKSKDCVITGSIPIKENNNYYNRLIWMRPDGTYEQYDKRHLFRISKEYNTYSGGDKRLIVDYKGWKILPQICFDLRFPVWSRNTMDYDLAIYIANWPEVRSHAWKSLLVARAIENQCYVIGVNRVGEGKRGEYHAGDSMVVDPLGRKIIKVSRVETEHTLVLSKEVIKKTREELPFLEEREEFEITFE